MNGPPQQQGYNQRERNNGARRQLSSSNSPSPSPQQQKPRERFDTQNSTDVESVTGTAPSTIHRYRSAGTAPSPSASTMGSPFKQQMPLQMKLGEGRHDEAKTVSQPATPIFQPVIPIAFHEDYKKIATLPHSEQYQALFNFVNHKASQSLSMEKLISGGGLSADSLNLQHFNQNDRFYGACIG
ncbi:unnamed protein product [Caenorhabditis bovis]|uniref:Uncharacterized protein n=1 Tax=Caenorhabditis bovis TaxID=2654633 RepID=A0A8S1F0C7_9PELO|nr:unnamed protein product [Caenorhabditis bovis]